MPARTPAIDTLTVDVPLTPLPPEEVLTGHPGTGAEQLLRFAGVDVGVWVMTEGSCTDVEVDEVFVVLEGAGQVVVEGSAPTVLRPGVLVRLRAGDRTTWRVDRPLRKLYVVESE